MERLTHIITSEQFNRNWLEEEFFPLVEQMEKKVSLGGSNDLIGKRMISFFYEPSTRTRASFEIAMDFMGGKVVFSTENAKQFSSVAKGETIEDTSRILSGFRPDVIVLRTDEEGMAKIAADFSSVPIINAGDGIGQHPTQALLDIYTIQKELGAIDGLTIAICGDLARGRTAKSLALLITKFKNMKVYFVAPDVMQIDETIKDYLRSHDVIVETSNDIREMASLADVIYQTRIQKERGTLVARYEAGKGFYKIDASVIGLMKEKAIVMHPLPRVEEITPEVDKDPRAAYFRQAENGLYVRMALLKMILG